MFIKMQTYVSFCIDTLFLIDYNYIGGDGMYKNYKFKSYSSDKPKN